MDKIGCRVMVSGKVQGVCFRFYTSKEAGKQALTGYAKNLANGDVEVALFGDREKIVNMLKWLKKGPKTSRVDEISVTEIPYVYTPDFLCL